MAGRRRVRYIHLNPLRAGLVLDLKTLNRYPYCGHRVLMAKRKNDWQDMDKILGMLGLPEGIATLSRPATFYATGR
jgi:hypothetical protein